jgi:hypothetical protein
MEIVIKVDVDNAVYRDKLDTDPAITVAICICADVLVQMVPTMVHRQVKRETIGTTPNRRTHR